MTDHVEHKDSAGAALRLSQESLALILSAHLAVVTALLASPQKCGAKVLRQAQNMGRILRRYLKAQHVLLSQKLCADLARSSAMRARVISDLGGTAALVRWERRKRDARTRRAFLAARRAQGLDSDNSNNTPEFIHSASSSLDDPKPASREPRPRWQPMTDRSGNFRLAKIPTGPTGKHVTTRIVKTPRRASRLFHPIEVTPYQLRPPAFPASHDSARPPDIGRRLAGVWPPIERWPKY